MPRLPILLGYAGLIAFGARSADLPAQAPRRVADTAWDRMASGLSYVVRSPGAGALARAGDTVAIHETTTLPNGTVVFSSREKNQPVTFVLGANHVIRGVDEGVTGMRVGERRVLIVPPALSQRSVYPANTPRDSTLRIDVELVSVRPRR